MARSGPVLPLRNILHQCKLFDARFKDTVLVTDKILHLPLSGRSARHSSTACFTKERHPGPRVPTGFRGGFVEGRVVHPDPPAVYIIAVLLTIRDPRTL